MLDLNRTLRDLRWELEKIKRVIAMLEAGRGIPPRTGRRGRKSMGQDERAEVSKRMKTYWANRRLSRTA